MLDNIYYLSLVITFVCGLSVYKKLDKGFKLLVLYMGFSIAYEFASAQGWTMWRRTNATCNNFEGIIEFCVFTYFMASLVKKSRDQKKIYLVAAVVLSLSFVDMLFIQGFLKRNTIAEIANCLYLLTLICIYYYNLFDEAEESIVLLKSPSFLAATGLFFYIASKSFFYSCFSYMAYKNNYHFYILASIIPVIANLFLNVLLIMAFLYSLNSRKLSL